MRAGIIAANNIRYSPYIFFYTKILESINVEYDLIFPDRNGIQESDEYVAYELPWNNRIPRVINYLWYSHRVKKILDKNKYDIIIALTGVNAAFLGMWLKKHYRRRYFIDIRDYSHENFFPFYLMEKEAVTNSMMNIISSRKFTEFLPKSNYSVCHNFNEENRIITHFRRANEPIRIGYVGGLSYVEQCTKLMRLVAADPRFTFEFYGTSEMERILKENAENLHCSRIVFHGGYIPSEKAGIIQGVDILFNAYGNGCPLLDYALSNKLYDALAYKKPILTCAGTYMTEMAGPLAFPIELNDENALNDLYKWYQELDEQYIDQYASELMDTIVEENHRTMELIKKHIMNQV